jgi:hypothetical protein
LSSAVSSGAETGQVSSAFQKGSLALICSHRRRRALPPKSRRIALISTVGAAALCAGNALGAPGGDQGWRPADTSAILRTWLSGVHFSGDIDVGATFNPEGPNTGINFGQLFTGKANQLVLNRFAVTMARPIGADPAAFDLGFRAQVAYGLDSQFIHFLGVGEHGSTGRNSIDMVEANVLAHAPLLTAGGIDLMAGFFTSPMGFEQIDPTGNFFYSNSYIFNFGTPRKHTGLLTTTHVTDWLDVYVGATTGVNTSFGPGGGDNDKTPHILGGVALKFDRLSIRALTHIGPEDPRSLVAGVPTAGGRTRFINDVVVSWGATDRLTTTTELNYVKDEGVRAAGGGVATYLTYALSPGFSAGVRSWPAIPAISTT